MNGISSISNIEDQLVFREGFQVVNWKSFKNIDIPFPQLKGKPLDFKFEDTEGGAAWKIIEVPLPPPEPPPGECASFAL